MISLFKKNIPGSGFDALGFPLKYRSAQEAGCAATRIPTAGLIFYAPLNAYADNAVTGHKLNYDGDVTFGTQNGIPCAFFDGDSAITTSETMGVNGTHPATVSAWIQTLGNFSSWRLAVSFGNGFADGSTLGLGALNNELFATTSGYDAPSSVDASEKMRHVVSVSDGETLYLYVGGVLVKSMSASFDIKDTELSIGWGYQGDCPFNGAVAAVRVYDRALSAAEIKALSGEFKA